VHGHQHRGGSAAVAVVAVGLDGAFLRWGRVEYDGARFDACKLSPRRTASAESSVESDAPGTSCAQEIREPPACVILCSTPILVRSIQKRGHGDHFQAREAAGGSAVQRDIRRKKES